MNADDRVLPHSGDSEDYLVGAMLRHEGAAAACRQVLPLDAFYSIGRARTIANVAYGLVASSSYVDLALVGDALVRRGEMTMIGGPTTLMDLAECAVSAAGLYQHVLIVLEYQLFRQAIDMGRACLEFGFGAHMDVQAGLRPARNLLWEISETERRILHVRDLIQAGATIKNRRSQAEGAPA